MFDKLIISLFKEWIGLLQGPANIEVTDEQLEKLKTNYETVVSDMQVLINDFFVPLNLMRDTGVFQGKSADKFVAFCDIVQYYLDIQIQHATEKFKDASTTFADDIHKAETSI